MEIFFNERHRKYAEVKNQGWKLKDNYWKGKNKNSGIYNTFSQTTIPGIDRQERLIPGLICHVNQSNEYYITLILGCSRTRGENEVITSYQIGCIHQICNIPGIKQPKISKKETPQRDINPGILRHGQSSKLVES